MNLYKNENSVYEIVDENYIKEIRESVASTIAGGVALAWGVAKLMKKGEDYWKNSGLRIGDDIQKVEIDQFRRKKEYEGKIVMKGSVPYVSITKGPDKVGQLVRWTPNWIKK